MDKLFKWASVILSLCSIGYTIWFISHGTPYENSGAISVLGLTYHRQFIIWGVLTYFSYALSISVAYKERLATRIHIPMLAIAGVGMVLMLNYSFNPEKKPDYYLHCAGAFAFAIVLCLTVLLLFALCSRDGYIFRIFSYLTAIVMIGASVCLLKYNEISLAEIIPIFIGYILLIVTNLGDEIVELKERINKS